MSVQAVTCSIPGDGSATVTLRGRLGIENAADLYGAVCQAFEAAERIELDAAALEGVDMTTLQVLCSACKTAAARQKKFTCATLPMPECLTSLGSSMGAPQGAACSQNGNQPCIWFGGVN